MGIFILPPSAVAWKDRLVGRGTESREALAKRLDRAVIEIRDALSWRHIVINDDLNRAVQEVGEIIDEDGAVPRRPHVTAPGLLVGELVREADRLRHEI